MDELLNSPFFGLTLSLGVYLLCVFINKKSKISALNPLLLTIIIILVILYGCGISYDSFNEGAKYIAVFLTPATVCLALPIFRKIDILKKNFLPIIIGCAVGAITCIVCVVLLCNAFGLDDTLLRSMVPKSITTPFGIAVSESIGGISSITIICIVITGVFGAVMAPYLIKWFKIDNDVAAGLAIGSCSHALGTTKALELGETQGAMSGLAISITGIMTVIYCLILF